MKHDRFGVYSIVLTAKDSGLRVVALLIILGGCVQLYGAVWGFNDIPSKAKSDMLLGVTSLIFGVGIFFASSSVKKNPKSYFKGFSVVLLVIYFSVSYLATLSNVTP